VFSDAADQETVRKSGPYKTLFFDLFEKVSTTSTGLLHFIYTGSDKTRLIRPLL
jgi:hypothetical protein